MTSEGEDFWVTPDVGILEAKQDLDSLLANLIVAFAEIESEIELMFARELNLEEPARGIFCKRVASVDERMRMISQALKSTPPGQEAFNALRKKIDTIRDVRNKCVHRIKRNNKEQLMHRSFDGAEEEVSAEVLEGAAQIAEQVKQDLWFFAGEFDDAQIMADLVLEPSKHAQTFLNFRLERGY